MRPILNTSIINDFNSDGTKIFSVSEINKLVKDLLQNNFPSIWIKGEISNFVEASSGHWYFTLKDNNAQVRCAMFRGRNSQVKWQPQNGDSIEAQCKIGLYEARGEYQLNIDSLQQAGLGQLFEAFNRLKLKLESEGLFSKAYKKPIPNFPRKIGVITSPDGAVIKDIITTAKRRNKSLNIIIYPTPVQGNPAIEGIINAIKIANKRNEVDVLILARGGGSIEDLWAFNDESVARCLSLSAIPTISAVGHETDVTITDFIADLRAPTPTAAAEIISVDLIEINERLEYIKSKLPTIIQSQINQIYQKIDYLEKRLTSPSEKILAQKIFLGNIFKRMRMAIKSSLNKYQNKIYLSQQNLTLLNPTEILSRGYSIVFDQNKNIINDIENITVNDKVQIKFHQGNAQANITQTNKKDTLK